VSRALPASLAASLLASLACSGRTSPSGPGPAPFDGGRPRATFSLDGADVTVHEGARLRLRAQARQVVLVPRTFGPFEVALLKELVVNGARITVEDGPPCRSLPSCVDRLLDDPTLGLASLAGGGDAVLRLATGSVVDASWTVRRGEAVVARFGARGARIGIGGRDLVLDGFELEQLWADRRVRAGRAVWDAEAHAVWIAGDFVLEEAGSTRTGRGLLIGVTEPG